MDYNQAHKDHSYLWNIGPADDMTGAYVDQEDLKMLLDSPSKRTATKCLVRQINYWFQAGPDASNRNSQHYFENDYEVRQIAERHNCL